jgi:hypothetical protein
VEYLEVYSSNVTPSLQCVQEYRIVILVQDNQSLTEFQNPAKAVATRNVQRQTRIFRKPISDVDLDVKNP